MQKKYSTWQVIRLLKRHPDWVFECPDSTITWPCTATFDGMHFCFVTHFPEDDGGDNDASPPDRDDWTRTLPDNKNPSRNNRVTEDDLIGTVDTMKAGGDPSEFAQLIKDIAVFVYEPTRTKEYNIFALERK